MANNLGREINIAIGSTMGAFAGFAEKKEDKRYLSDYAVYPDGRSACNVPWTFKS